MYFADGWVTQWQRLPVVPRPNSGPAPLSFTFAWLHGRVNFT